MGALQAGIVVVLAISLAVFLGGEELGVKEAAISAMIVMITFRSSGTDLPIERFLEALIGGGTALLVNALLPINPERMVEEAADPVFGESASALEEGDAERAHDAYLKAREIDARVSGLKQVLTAGRETARLSPPRRASLRHLDLYAAASEQIDLIVRDVRALARAALSVVGPADAAPEALPAAIRALARATGTLAVYLETSGDPADARWLALEAAREASVLLEEREELSRSLPVNALVDQIHSTAVDVLGGTGMDRGSALRALGEAARSTSGPGMDDPV